MLTCICHTLNLLVKDIFKCDQLQTFDTKVVSIIKTIKYNQTFTQNSENFKGKKYKCICSIASENSVAESLDLL